MNTAFFYLTEEGKNLALKLSAKHPGDLYGKDNFKENLQMAFQKYDYLVCIMATGIVVRILAPLVVHKTSDPGVVVMDQKGAHAISLLSGHLGGANELAREMARISGGDPVITTATDVAGELSFDVFAKNNQMTIENISELKHISGALLAGQKVRVFTDYEFSELTQGKNAEKLEIIPLSTLKSLSGNSNGIDRKIPKEDTFTDISTPVVVIDEGFTFHPLSACPVLYLRPRTICVGIGCKRNMEAAPIEQALLYTLKKEGLSPLSLKCLSTIPLKADEPGILTTAAHLNLPLVVIPTEEIEKLNIAELGIATSDFVASQTGVLSVSTASSYLASGKGIILKDKEKYKGITIALSKTNDLPTLKKM